MPYPFILTFIASFSTMLGTIPIFFKIKNRNKLLGVSCAFASGIMISISILDLIPEGIKYLNNYPEIMIIMVSFLSLLLGNIVGTLLDKTIPKNDDIYHTGILSLIAIVIHNIPEGIITFFISSKNLILGIPLCLSIAMHNIPEGLSIAIPLYYSTKKRYISIFYTFISSLSELFGAFITYLLLKNYISNLLMGIILNFTAGIMLNISLNELVPIAKKYAKKGFKIAFIIGILFMLLSLRLNSLFS